MIERAGEADEAFCLAVRRKAAERRGRGSGLTRA